MSKKESAKVLGQLALANAIVTQAAKDRNERARQERASKRVAIEARLGTLGASGKVGPDAQITGEDRQILCRDETLYGSGKTQARTGKGYVTKVGDLYKWVVEIPEADNNYRIAFGIRGYTESQGDALVYISNVLITQDVRDLQIFVNR